MSEPVRVVLADDQTLVRHGIRSLLEIAGGFEIVAEAGDGAAAVVAVTEHRPDVLLLDLRMPGRDGLWALETLRDSGDETAVLVLTTFDDNDLVLRALRLGVQGYQLKDVTLEELARAVRTLADGGTALQLSITDRLLRVTRGRAGQVPVDGWFPEPLTDRETEVLRLMAEGCSNREIADALYLAEGTVKNHVSAVLLKLGVRDRTKAVLRALHHGLLS